MNPILSYSGITGGSMMNHRETIQVITRCVQAATQDRLLTNRPTPTRDGCIVMFRGERLPTPAHFRRAVQLLSRSPDLEIVSLLFDISKIKVPLKTIPFYSFDMSLLLAPDERSQGERPFRISYSSANCALFIGVP